MVQRKSSSASKPPLTRAKAERSIGKLTPAQTAVFAHILRGRSAIEIGKKLGISPFTVSNHTRVIFDAFKTNSRTELMAAFVVLPELELPEKAPKRAKARRTKR